MLRLPQQLQLSFEIPHHLVTSFLCCTALQIPRTRVHTCKCAHPAHCVRTLVAYARGLCLSKKVTLEDCGGRDRALRRGMGECSSFRAYLLLTFRESYAHTWKTESCPVSLCAQVSSFLGVKQNKANRFPPFFFCFPLSWGGGQCFSGPLEQI